MRLYRLQRQVEWNEWLRHRARVEKRLDLIAMTCGGLAGTALSVILAWLFLA